MMDYPILLLMIDSSTSFNDCFNSTAFWIRVCAKYIHLGAKYFVKSKLRKYDSDVTISLLFSLSFIIQFIFKGKTKTCPWTFLFTEIEL